MEEILKYFTNLTELQLKQISSLKSLYTDWNIKINVISRKDIDNFYQHHLLHSLAIAKFINFRDDTTILDIGTGGGFPGIPLAIMFPKCTFKLIDRTKKKIFVASEIAKEIELNNVVLEQKSAEDEKEKYDFVVSRGVMPLSELMNISKKNISKSQKNAYPNGFIVLKGGDLTAEISPFKRIAIVEEVKNYFDLEWFKTKRLIYVPA